MLRSLQTHWRLSAIAVILSVGLLIGHTLWGTPDGYSYKHNMPWFDAFRSAFWAGDLYPRFLPNLWYGLGGVDFYYYGPLPFWIATLLGEASCPGCGTETVLSLGGAWMIILSGVSFFCLARRFFPVVWAGGGSLVYTLLPYHYLTDWFVRQAIGEVAALIFLPLLVLSAIQLIEEKRGGLLFAFSFAAITLSHLPSALIVVHLVVAIVLWQVFARISDWPRRLAMLTRFTIWGGLGAALSAVYWLPAFALLSDVSPELLYTPYADPVNWLLLDGRPEPNPKSMVIIKPLLALALSAALAAWLVLRVHTDEQSKTLTVWIIGPILFAAFLMSVFALPIWQVWILSSIQFPWRTLIVADVSIALAAIAVVKAIAESKDLRSYRPALLAGGAGLTALALSVSAALPQAISATERGLALDGTFEPTGAPEYIPPAFLELAQERFGETVENSASSQSRYDGFFAETRRGYEMALTALQADTEQAELTPLINDRVRLTATLAEAGSVRVPLASWRYWRARNVDGTPIDLGEDASLGVLTLDLPAGASEVEFYLIETLPQRIGSGLSLLALLLALAWTVRARLPRLSRREKPLATSMA